MESVFIDIPEKEQAQEIRQYLISAGADLQSTSKQMIHEEIDCLLDACDNWLKSACDADLEAMMNSFISIIQVCPYDVDKLTQKFCSKMSNIGACEGNALLRIKILNNLFNGLAEENNLRFDVYISQVKLASTFGLTAAIRTQLTQVKSWLQKWNVSMEQRRICYLELHSALKGQLKSSEATNMLLEFLSTYDELSASQAEKDANYCIIDFISRPDVFVMDHLLKLKPVQYLENTPIYQLLKIFVEGTMSDYLKFFSLNQQFMATSGLRHEDCVNKIRILTFLTLASQKSFISFDQCTLHLGIDERDIEDFVVELVQSGLVHAKIDQLKREIVIRSFTRRTFEKKEWNELRSKLESWKDNLQTIQESLQKVVLPQMVA